MENPRNMLPESPEDLRGVEVVPEKARQRSHQRTLTAETATPSVDRDDRDDRRRDQRGAGGKPVESVDAG